MGEPSWSYWVDEAQAHAMAGRCYLRLQDWERARGHLSDALRLQTDAFAREGVTRHIRLAQIYLRQDWPDLDQALVHGGKAVDALSGAVNSPRIVKRLAPLINGLAPFQKRPDVTDFTARATILLTPTNPQT